MTRRYVISDLHFSHPNIIQYERTQFKDVNEMNQHMIQCWNSVVTDQDIIYVLGDVCWNKKAFDCLSSLKGRKRLILGNHDTYSMNLYLQYFEKIFGVKHLEIEDYGTVVLTHVPIHPDGLGTRYKLNLHGHLHSTVLEDRRYINCCCEPLDFIPRLIDELVAQHREELSSEKSD